MVGDNPMGEEQKKWHQQFSASFGLQEYLRFSCAILIWNFLGVILGLVLEFAGYSMGGFVVAIFVVMMFVFPFVVWSWKPAYSILRLILGKEKLPPELPTLRLQKCLTSHVLGGLFFQVFGGIYGYYSFSIL